MPARTEAEIQKAIMDALKRGGLPVWRTNSHRTSANPPGFPDLIAVSRTGRFVAIEVKRPGGKQSPEQIEFQREVIRSNGVYILATDVDAIMWLLSGREV